METLKMKEEIQREIIDGYRVRLKYLETLATLKMLYGMVVGLFLGITLVAVIYFGSGGKLWM